MPTCGRARRTSRSASVAGGCRVGTPIFGIQGGRPSDYDFAVGGRVSLWRDSPFAFGNAIVPLNDDGFRSDVIPLIGLEYTF